MMNNLVNLCRISTLTAHTYNTIPIYQMLTSFILEKGVVQVYHAYPNYTMTPEGAMLVFNKYRHKKYVLYLRMSMEFDYDEDVLSVKSWANFPFTYDDISQLLYFQHNTDNELTIHNGNKQLFMRRIKKYIRIVLIPDVEKDQKCTVDLELHKYEQLSNMITSLPMICGWHLPQQFLSAIKPKE